MLQNLSEHASKPSALVVHGPVRWGAFRTFDGERGRTCEQLLFQGIFDPEAYREHLAFLHTTLMQLVDDVHYLDRLIDAGANASQFAANPNQVFTRDSAVTLPWAPDKYVPCAMAHEIRRDEPRLMALALGTLGLAPLIKLPAGLVLEGGDVIPFEYDGNRCLFVGHGPRTSLAAVDYLSQHLIPEWLDEIISIHLSPRRINLDGAFCPVDHCLAIANLDSLLGTRRYDASGARDVTVRRVMEELGLALIEVGFKDSRGRQSCNCFCAGDRQVVMYNLCPDVAKALGKAGLSVTLVPGAELVKGNGGPRCMTWPVYA